MRNRIDNDIESWSNQLNQWIDNFNGEERQNQYKEIQDENKNAREEQHNKAERLKLILKKWDNDEILAEFLDLDKDSIEYINHIKNDWKPKDISNELAFLNDSQRIAQTQKEYNWLFKKVKNELIDFIFEIDNITNNWWDIKNYISKLKDKYKKLFKNIKKLQKYEKWEFINFPNWITFELCQHSESNIPNNINLWENDYFIKTHIEKGSEHYIEYVNSLLIARKLFKSKWINIKYCRRETWLANRKFIEAYEKIRRSRKAKEWKDYKKTNRLKVLEQTENAVIYEEVKTNSDPIRFIDENKNSDLYNFATGDGKELFHETIMRLDLDKLSLIEKLKINVKENFLKLKWFFVKK